MSLEILVKRAFARLGYQIAQIPVRLWEEDNFFKDAMGETLGRTLVDTTRCFMLYQYAVEAAALPAGQVAEVGVYKGGTARLLARTFERSGKTLHLFDTFAGMPETDAGKDNVHRSGDFADTSLESVKAFVGGAKRVEFHPGFFPQTAAGLKDEKFSLVHVDVDIYRSVVDCCEFFYPRLVPEGVMVFDDYGLPSCAGARQAVDEFFATKSDRPLYLPTGQCVVRKRG